MNGSEVAEEGEPEMTSGVRLVVLNLPEDEGEGLGFRLTRTLWDPYPWVREVTAASRADVAGLRMGDCLLQADGKDLLGLPVGQVAGLIRGDGAGRGVSLLVWNCGVDPKDDPELLWSCGGGARGERARRALGGAVRALACSVCGSTAQRARACARSHLYCEPCWTRLDRCALCREPLPDKDSPYARNLVAEQVFEAIAAEYEIKDTTKKPRETLSAYNTPNRSPNLSPAVTRRGQYLSLINRKKNVQFNSLSYGSDPNIHRTSELNRQKPTISAQNFANGNTSCQCQSQQIPQIKVEDLSAGLQHKLVARLRHACSLADLHNAGVQCCTLSRSLNNLGDCSSKENNGNSLENLKSGCSSACDSPILLLPAPPVYVLACEHKRE